MQYKIPTREDFGNIRVAFESSYEESGPFGAKSIGELVIDTPCPAIAEAIYNATGVRVRNFRSHRRRLRWESSKRNWRNKMSIILKGILALFWLLLVPAAIGILFMSKRKRHLSGSMPRCRLDIWCIFIDGDIHTSIDFLKAPSYSDSIVW